MTSSVVFPFNYLEHYFKSTIYDDLRRFYLSYEHAGLPIKRIDRTLHIVEVHEDLNAEDGLSIRVFTFEQSVKTIINSELIKSRQLIELGFKQVYDDKGNVHAHANFLRLK